MPPATRYSCFVFTCNNPTPEQEKWLQETVSKTCTFLIYGHENAPTTGTPHLQGFFVLNNPATKANQVQKFSKHQMWIGVPTDKEKTPSYWLQYCTKEDAQPFQFGTIPPDEFYLSEISKQGERKRNDLSALIEAIDNGDRSLVSLRRKFPGVCARFPQFVRQMLADTAPRPLPPNIELRPWQVELIEILRGPVDDRKIYWYTDIVGNAGKTTFGKYIYATLDNVQILKPGKSADLAYILKDTTSIIILDLQRSKDQFFPYSFMEDVKDCVILNPKYESHMMYSNPCHLVVFSNSSPEPGKLSEDRIVEKFL